LIQLRPYQEAGAAFLAERKSALLADSPRVGKTLQAIEACRQVDAQHVLVVCPASAVEHWKREFARVYEPFILAVISYNKIASEADSLPDVLILDEAHYLKNKKAKRTQAVFGKRCQGDGLVSRAERVFLLTGTPMPKDPSELWPALRALAPELIHSKDGKPFNFHQFVTRYCKTRHNGFGIEIVGAKNHDKFVEVLKPFMLRRTLADVAPEMPPLLFDTLPVNARFPIVGLSKEIEIAAKAFEKDGLEGLAKIAGHIATLRRLTGMAKVPAVVEWVSDYVAGGGGKLVLFAHHRDVLHALEEGCTDIGLFPTYVDGSTGARVRQDEIDTFQNEPTVKVFIGQMQAAGTAIRLDAADEALFVEWSYVPSDNYQPACRILDVNKKAPCIARFVTIPGSIDERIAEVAARRTADVEKILGGM
jgi:SWI/SNF-related matrix-associated actin-dependent regulator 1 of chromatin subfamily A